MTLVPPNPEYQYIQDTKPSDPKKSDWWLDTSTSPPQSKVYDGASFVRPQAVDFVDGRVSEAGGGAAVKKHDTRFVREMTRLFFDRSLQELNFSDGIFDAFTESKGITVTPSNTAAFGVNGGVTAGTTVNATTIEFTPASFEKERSGVVISSDGTRMVTQDDSEFQLNEYTLSTPYDITTASANGNTYSTNGNGWGLYYRDDETQLFATDQGLVRQLDLSTANDISTASETSTLSTSTNARGIALLNSGSVMLLIDDNQIVRFDLSTAYDITTATQVDTGSITSNDYFSVIESTNELFTQNGSGSILRYTYDLSNGEISVSQTATFTAAYDDDGQTGSGMDIYDSDTKLVTNDVSTGSGDKYQHNLNDVSSFDVEKTKDIGFIPSTAVVTDTSSGLSVDYDISDGNGNTVTISDADVDSVVDVSALNGSNLTVTAKATGGSSGDQLEDFALYFD